MPLVHVSTTLPPYLPRSLVRAIDRGGPPRAPDAEVFQATVLFADISGYTALSERLGAMGHEGPERVRAFLDRSFSRLVELITRRGGDVLEFDGDAILAIWRHREGLAATAQAVACGLEIQAEASEAPEVEGEPLRLKVAIGRGDCRLFYVPTASNKSRALFTGPGVTSAMRVLEVLEAGDVGLASEADHQLGPGALERARRGPARLIAERGPLPPTPAPPAPLPPLSHERLAPFVADTIVRRGDVNDSFGAELRGLSIVFIILEGLDTSTPDERARVARALSAVREVFDRLEGSINQVVADEKGLVVLGAFGLPFLAHEDDASRAVSAGTALVAELGDAGFELGVGVTSGRAYCGDYGTAERRRYAIVGSVVNRAARLAHRAKNTVFCDGDTATAASKRWSFGAGQSIRAKGVGSIEVYTPSEQRARTTLVAAEHAFVGRDAELEAIRERLERVGGEGPAATVIVEGEAGIGKSAFLDAALKRAGAAGQDTLIGVADSIEAATAYYAWRPVFAELLEATSGDPTTRRARARAKLGALEDEQMHEWAPLLDAVVPLGFEDNEVTASMSEAVRAAATAALLVELVRARARSGKLVVALEDMHWGDSASWALFDAIRRRVAGVGLVLATRPFEGDAPADYQAAVAADSLHIELPPLGGEALSRLLATTLGVKHVADEICAFVEERARGNPFYCRELAHGLRESGGIECVNDLARVHGKGLAELAFPDSVHGVVTARLDRLEPKLAAIVKAAAVVGQVFTLDALAVAAGDAFSAEVLRAGLGELREQDFLVEGDEQRFGFEHAIIRDVAYGQLAFEQRRATHGAIADWLEAKLDADPESTYPSLAHHFRFAGREEEELTYAERSGEVALKRGANREAVAFYERVLELGGSRSVSAMDAARWEGQMAAGYYGLGELDVSRSHFNVALARLEQPPPRSNFGWLVHAGFAIARQFTHRLLPRSWIATNDESKRATLRTAASYVAQVAEQYYYQTEVPRMIVSLIAAINLAERAGEESLAARSYGILGYMTGVGRLHPLANVYFKLGRLGNDARNVANTLYAHGLYHLGFGRWKDCFRHLDEGTDLAMSVGDEFSRALALTIGASAHHYSGSTQTALDTFQELLDSGRKRKNVQHELWGLTGMAEVLLSFDQHEEAMHYLEQAHRILDQGDGLSAPRFHGLHAWAHVKAGDLDRGMSCVEEWLALGAVLKQPLYAFYWGFSGTMETLIEYRRRSGHEDAKWRKQWAEARSAMRTYTWAFPFAKCRLLYLDAKVADARGQTDKAIKLWQRSLAAARVAGVHYDMAVCHLALAEHETSEPHQEQARDILRRIECPLLENLAAHDEAARPQSHP